MGKDYDVERTTIEVWRCPTCGKSWRAKEGDDTAERIARGCCCDHKPCVQCGKPTSASYNTLCDVCLRERDHKRWLQFEVRPLEFPLTLLDDGVWFRDEDELLEYCDENECKPEDLPLMICERLEPRIFDSEFYVDDLAEDDDPFDAEFYELAKQINQWAKDNIVSYQMGLFRPDVSGLEDE